ncbi:MAG: dephospho-CoA kinase [Granulosicoccaceae bacterium]|jgi:dephospho-CoA kinase
MLVIGLTGGIGSGKSTVAGLFRQRDIPVIDADQIAHELVAPGSSALASIAQTFGPGILTDKGKLDRGQLRDRVFHDPTQRAQLEAILHPLVRDRIRAWLARQQACYVIVVIPLLIEAGMQHQVDRILVVDCAESLQIERVMQRDQLDETLVRAILAAQVDRSARLQQADDVIDNTGDPADIEAAVTALDEYYRTLC